MTKILYFLVCLFCIFPLMGQNNKVEIDSTLFVYYQKCENLSKTPQIFSVSDSLFNMAGKLGDERTQAAALCHKANYYFYVEQNMDSLEKYTKIVKKFAKKTGQPKYYYWIWGRYIEGFLNMRQFNFALLELKDMQKEALEDDYIPGLISGYKQMMQIYIMKNNNLLAYEYLKKAVDLTERYNIDDFNMSILYSNLANILINLERIDEAYVYLEKAYKTVKIPSQLFSTKRIEVLYWLHKKDAKRMLPIIKEMEAMNIPSRKNLMMETWSYYYCVTGDYGKANAIYDSIYKNNGLTKLVYLQCKKNALRYIPGREKETIKCLDDLVSLRDSLNMADAQTSLSEFGTIMDVNRLNKENANLELDISKQKLRTTYSILIGLGILFLAIGAFTIKVLRLNRKLRRSEMDLINKNNELIAADKIIVKEKERAESASRMKTAFIENMSHEIRTPLNSIVGFAQVLAEELKEQEEMKTYAHIITENSNNLLKLIDDVIEISSLDAVGKEVHKAPVSLNVLCALTVERVMEMVKPDVKIYFNAWKDEFLVLSDDRLLTSILFNLLHNAAKFTEKGSITIDCGLIPETQQIRINVTDTGMGIPEDRREWIFERFAKINEFTQGTGLGLAISRLAAQHLGGNLFVDTDYKGGTKMCLTFTAEKYGTKL